MCSMRYSESFIRKAGHASQQEKFDIGSTIVEPGRILVVVQVPLSYTFISISTDINDLELSI